MSTKLMTKVEVAERLGRSPRAVEWMIYAGTGPKSGVLAGRRMFREADVEAWIDAQFEESA